MRLVNFLELKIKPLRSNINRHQCVIQKEFSDSLFFYCLQQYLMQISPVNRQIRRAVFFNEGLAHRQSPRNTPVICAA